MYVRHRNRLNESIMAGIKNIQITIKHSFIKSFILSYMFRPHGVIIRLASRT